MGSQARSGLRHRHVLLVVLLASVSCSEATPPGALDSQVTLEPRPAAQSSGPPTTIRLVLQLQQDGTFRMISAEPRRGEVTPDPSVEDNRPALAEGRAKLVEYSARNAGGEVVATGRFIVPLVAVSEFQDPNASTRIRHSEERLTTPTIRVAVPYQASIAMIAFDSLEPGASAEPREWKRTTMGEVKVPLAPQNQQPR
jgi:hypothetical protein